MLPNHWWVDQKQTVLCRPLFFFKRCQALYKSTTNLNSSDRQTVCSLYTAMNYCRLKSLFTMPVVHAEATSATHIIEKRVKEQRNQPGIMISDQDIYSCISKETGRARLIQMFSRDDKGVLSPEMELMGQATVRACAVTFLVMAYFGGKRAKEQHLAENKTTIFKTKFKAARALNDAMFLGGAKEGMRWATKVVIFTASYLLISQTIAVYRNKSSPLEYTVAGAVTGSVFKINLGLKGTFVGSLVGGVMGLVSGLLMYGVMWAGDQTQEQRHFRQVQTHLETQKELHGLLGKTELFPEEIKEPFAS